MRLRLSVCGTVLTTRTRGATADNKMYPPSQTAGRPAPGRYTAPIKPASSCEEYEEYQELDNMEV